MSGCGGVSASNSLQHLKQRRTHVAKGSIGASPRDKSSKFSGVGKFYLHSLTQLASSPKRKPHRRLDRTTELTQIPGRVSKEVHAIEQRPESPP